MDKKQLRQFAKDIRAGIDGDQRARDELALSSNVNIVIAGERQRPRQSIHNQDCMDCFTNARNDGLVMGVYYPIGTEIKPPMNFLRVALPVIRHDQSLEFYLWNEGDVLVKRHFNIPIPDTRHKNPVIPDVILAPLLLCDLNGNRLGYGKGHYDRYLVSLDTKPLLIGVCFDEQIYDDALPAEDHDVKLDFIVTPKRIIEVV